MAGDSTLAFDGSTFFSSMGGEGSDFSDGFSDGATWEATSADFEIIAILVPGSTVSPSLATN